MSDKKRYVLVGTGGRAEFFMAHWPRISATNPSLLPFAISTKLA